MLPGKWPVENLSRKEHNTPIQQQLSVAAASRHSSNVSTNIGGFRPLRRVPVVSTMAAEGSRSLVRLNAVDRRGRKIEPAVLAAAEAIYPKVLEHGLRLLGDPAVVTTALEEVAARVSR